MITAADPATDELITIAASTVAELVGDDFLAALGVAADEYLATQRPQNTIAAYADDWKVWTLFCASKTVPVDLANDDLLVAFVVWMEEVKQYAPSTMERRITGTVATLRSRLGLERVPKGIGAKASQAIVGYDRRLRKANIKRGRGEAPLITTAMIRSMVETIPVDTLLGLRNRALLLFWYHLGGRRIELADLDVTDVQTEDEILPVHIRDSKTGEKEPIISRHPESDLCPVAAWEAWLATSGITHGPAFPRMDRHGNLLGRLSGKSIGKVVTAAGRAAGIEVHLTGHGMRAGHITTALGNGASRKVVALQTGHDPNGRAMSRYERRAERSSDNSSKSIQI